MKDTNMKHVCVNNKQNAVFLLLWLSEHIWPDQRSVLKLFLCVIVSVNVLLLNHISCCDSFVPSHSLLHYAHPKSLSLVFRAEIWLLASAFGSRRPVCRALWWSDFVNPSEDQTSLFSIIWSCHEVGMASNGASWDMYRLRQWVVCREHGSVRVFEAAHRWWMWRPQSR